MRHVLFVTIFVSQDSVLDLAVITGGLQENAKLGLRGSCLSKTAASPQGSSPAETVCVMYPVSREGSKCRALKGTCWHDYMMLQENAKSGCR